MDKDKGQQGRIDRILVGDPIAAGGRTLEPVARAGGWYGGGDGEQGRGFAAWLRVQPLEVRVCDPDGAEHTVYISDPTGQAIRQIALFGLLVSAVSMALLLLAGLVRFGKARGL
jgi:hypothetical protein